MPKFYQTAGPRSDTLRCSSAGSSNFTTLWRAKHKKDRLKICFLAKSIYCNGKSGIKYSQPRSNQLLSDIKHIQGYNARIKAGMNRKFKGHYVDCSHFAAACALGAGVSYGYLKSTLLVKAGSLTHFTKHDAQKEFRNKTFQKGDIVAYPEGHNGLKDGHVAVVANHGSASKHLFDNYMEDGSKKPTKTKKIKQAIKTKKKKSNKQLKKTSLSQLKAYYKQLKNACDDVDHKLDALKKKVKTTQRDKYIKKLDDLLDDLKAKKNSVKKKIDNYKPEKKRPKKKKQNKSKNTTTKNTTSKNTTNTNNSSSKSGNSSSTTTTKTAEGNEPKPSSELIDYYYIRSGPNHFSNNNLHKDYLGKIFCKKKIKIPTLITDLNVWTFTFDMPFVSCNNKSGNISSIQKMSSDKEWKVTIQTPKNSQEDYWFELKTSLNVVYHILCQIEID